MLYVLELGTVNLVGGVISTMFSHCGFTVCSFVFIIGLLPVGYVSYYTIVAYDICVMISVGR